MRAWYVARTKPQMEKTANTHLQQQGYVTYLPMLYSGVERKIVPMFPGYAFINLCDKTEDWGPIRSTRGVLDLIRFGVQAARCPEGLVEMIKYREGRDGVHDLNDGLKPGDKVLINNGIFRYYEAIVQAKTAADRVSLLVQGLGYGFRLDLQLTDIEAIA